MAGIADVQPKSINIPQMVGTVVPAATPSAVEQLANAFRQGFVTTNDIMAHPGGNALTQGLVEKKKLTAEGQLAGEIMDPQAIEARQEAQRLVGDKAKQERATLLSKDFVGAYLKYNLPLNKPDGTPDYTGMAEVGQKYADMERTLAYARAGVTGTPQNFIDEAGKVRTRMINAYGEDVTMVPGQTNKVLDHYQKLIRNASTFLIQNDKEPSLTEGQEAPVLNVSPKDMIETPPAAPMISALPPAPLPPATPSIPVIERATATAPTPVVPIAGAVPGLPSANNMAAGGFVQPAAPPAQVAPAKITIEPTGGITVHGPQVAAPPSEYVPGTGMVTAKGEFDPDAYHKDVQASEFVKNWSEKSPVISGFRQIVNAYKSMPPGSITTQNDIDLANSVLQLNAPGASAGGRGMREYQVQRIEESVPLLEQIAGIPAHVLKTHKFEEGTRQRLIEAGERKAQAIESIARDALGTASKRLTEKGYDPGKILFGPEQQLLQSSTPGTASGAGRTITLPSGRKVVVSQ